MHELNNGSINRDPGYHPLLEDIVYRDAAGDTDAMESIKAIDPSLWTRGMIADATGRYPTEIGYQEMIMELTINPSAWPDGWLSVIHEYLREDTIKQFGFRGGAGPKR